MDARFVASGSFVGLRPVVESDYPSILAIEQAGTNLGHYRHRAVTLSPDAFVASLWAGVTCQFVVCELESKQGIGVVAAYDMNHRHRHCKIAGVLDPSRVGAGWGLEGFMLLLSYLFREFDLRKVYADVLPPNLVAFASSVGPVFEQEGCLKDHEFGGGGYWDLHLLAVTRERWADFIARRPSAVLLERLGMDG